MHGCHCLLCVSKIGFSPGASAPTDLTAVQEGPTSIRVSWTPSSGATGYKIDYTSSDDSSDSVTVSGGSTDNYLLTGLQNGDTYTISIVATSDSLPSGSVTADTTVGLREYVYTHFAVQYSPIFNIISM